jgi:prevent-host-death family protein
MLTMLMINIADAKARLSEYVDAALRGEQVLICKRNKPVAELRAVEPAAVGPRDLAPMFPGKTFMTDAFFEPMPEEELRDWYGDPAPPARVAEPKGAYGKIKARKRRA